MYIFFGNRLQAVDCQYCNYTYLMKMKAGSEKRIAGAHLRITLLRLGSLPRADAPMMANVPK